jgi:hypothetical protein
MASRTTTAATAERRLTGRSLRLQRSRQRVDIYWLRREDRVAVQRRWLVIVTLFAAGAVGATSSLTHLQLRSVQPRAARSGGP